MNTTNTTETFGYNPNRDSGIAPARSYIEIPKEKLQGMVSEYNLPGLNPTQRYFAQVVYNVGASTGGSGLSATDTANLLWLEKNLTKLSGLLELTVDLNTIDIPIKPIVETKTLELSTENIIIPVYKSADGTIEIVGDNEDYDNDPTTEFLINVQGFVCGVECHTWLDDNKTAVTQTLERFLPKMTFLPKSTQYPFGLTRIFLSRFEYNLIAELPEEVRKIRIIYQRMPTLIQSPTSLTE